MTTVELAPPKGGFGYRHPRAAGGARAPARGDGGDAGARDAVDGGTVCRDVSHGCVAVDG